MIKTKLFLTVICISWLYVIAQAQETTYWPFSYGAINLKTIPPTYTYSRANAVYTNTVMCDSMGNLLFYSSGDTVWNRNHEVMDGGGLNLSVVKPQVGHLRTGVNFCMRSTTNPDLYFILYLAENYSSQFKSTLYKITIDISKNGGLGKVIRCDTLYKNPLTNLVLKRNSMENSWWLFTYSFSKDSFYIFKFAQDSLSLVQKYRLPFRYYLYNFGVTISHNNKLLFFYDTANANLKLWEFGFNENDAKITAKGVILDTLDPPQRCILSPSDTILFHASTNNILQFNLYTKEWIQYNVGGTSTTLAHYFYALKYAPNGKLYYHTILTTIGKNYISEIKYPDRITNQNCLVSYLASPYTFSLSTTLFPYDEDPITRLEFEYANTCDGLIFYNRSDTGFFKSFTWYFNDNDSFVQKTPHTNRWNNNPIFAYDNFPLKTGNYFVKIRGTKPSGYSLWGYDSVLYIAPPKAKFSTQSAQGCQYIAFQFNDSSFADTVNSSGYSYYWDYGDGTTEKIEKSKTKIQKVKHTYNQSGTFTVRLIFSNGFCSDTFSYINKVVILPAPKPGFNLNTHNGCVPFKLRLTDTLKSNILMKEYDFGNGFMVVNNTRALDTNLQFSAPGTYIIKQKLTGITGCVTQFVDTFKVLNGINANDTIKVFYTTVLDSLSTKTIWNSMPFAVRYSINNKNTKDTFYIDPSATPNLQSQKYFIRAIDTCGNQSAVSLVAQTINLNASNQNFNEFALLEYTPYETWLNGVLEYRIEYYNKMSSQWELLSTADPGIFKYRASVSPVYKGISNSSADICYRIVAIERSGNKQVSISNTACVPVYPIVFIPTAFSPNNDGLNDYYKPSYAGLNVYTFEIYDRWGQMVYSDSFDSKGWDGTFRGKPAEAGAYVYRLSAVGYLKSQDNNDSRFVERKGTLFLIR